MMSNATSTSFNKMIKMGFLFVLLAAVSVGLASAIVLKHLETTSLEFSFNEAQDLADVDSLAIGVEKSVSAGRAFLLSSDRQYLIRLGQQEQKTNEIIAHLAVSQSNEEFKMSIQRLQEVYDKYLLKLYSLVQMRTSGSSIKNIIGNFERDLQPSRNLLEESLQKVRTAKKIEFEEGKKELLTSFTRSRALILYIVVVGLALAATLAFIFTRVLTRLYARATQASSDREEILAVVAHDLKNPLAAIRLNVQLQQRKMDAHKSDLQLQKSLTMMGRSLDIMESLIEDLLTAARLEADEIILNIASVKISAALRDLIEEFNSIAATKGIKLVEKFEDKEFEVVCDLKRIRQVVSNLLGNAIKFSPQNTRITISLNSQAHMQRICIQDEGPGIPPENLSNVFERFKQVRPEDARKGTGLGLYISKKIIEAHRGQIWVENIKEHGAAFYFTLPLQKDSNS